MQDHIEQVEHAAAVGQPQHRADLIGGGFASAVADRLIEQGLRIAGGPFGGAGDEGERLIRDLGPFGGGDFAQEGDMCFGFDPTQIKALTAGQDRDGHLPNFGGRKDEFDMLGWFFQRLQAAR